MVDQMISDSKAIRELCEAICKDLDKVDQLNAWTQAAKRVRASTVKLTKVGKSFRKSSIEATKVWREQKKESLNG